MIMFLHSEISANSLNVLPTLGFVPLKVKRKA